MLFTPNLFPDPLRIPYELLEVRLSFLYNPLFPFLTLGPRETHFKGKCISGYCKTYISTHNRMKHISKYNFWPLKPKMFYSHPARFVIKILAINCTKYGFLSEMAQNLTRLVFKLGFARNTFLSTRTFMNFLERVFKSWIVWRAVYRQPFPRVELSGPRPG